MPLTAEILDRYRAAGLTDAGAEYISMVRSSPPARRIGGSRFLSVSGRFPSNKMGCTIQAESRTAEYPFVLTLELDDDVIEFYDQPASVQVTRIRHDRKHVSAYTADFLVLRSTHPEVVEVKPRQVVDKAREKYPDEWALEGDRWVCLPAAAQFNQLGIRYWVHVAEDIKPILAANLNILVAARRVAPGRDEASVLARLRKVIRTERATTIQMIVDDLELPDASTVLRWIASGILFAATSDQLLTDVRAARVFGDKTAVDRFLAARVMDRGNLLLPIGSIPEATAAGAEDATGEALTDRQLKLAVERYTAVLPALRGERPPTRNERRQIKRMNKAIAAGLGPLHGLVPQFHKQGNRTPRTTAAQEALMSDAIANLYSTAAKRSARWVYASIDWGTVPRSSYNTFLSLICRTPKNEIARARSGHRAGLALRPQSHPDVRAAWPTIAWELVHIDHTPIDEKVWGQLGIALVLGRPWLTTMIDGYSRAAIAFWLSFSPPSWQSLAMLLRDCVRRHRRLPLAWISDQGSEFGGEFWEIFSASHACTKFDRAVADARCGSQVESSFHILHRDLIYQLDGNMQNDREWRNATSSHKSNATARYLLERIYKEIDRYLFEYYNEKPHGTATFSPQQMLMQAQADMGNLIRPVNYDYKFLVETAHRAPRPTYKLDSRRGIRVGQRVYWHNDFAQPKFNGNRVEVRLEPLNSSKIYAHLDGIWVECVGARHAELNSLEEFGRWAQSAIDYFGRPYAASVRRAADERFARRQKEAWSSEQEQIVSVKPEPREGEISPDGLAQGDSCVAAQHAALDEIVDTQSPFTRLRKAPMKPLKEMPS